MCDWLFVPCVPVDVWCRYVGLVPLSVIYTPDGGCFKQMDVKLLPIQMDRGEQDNKKLVSVGLGITLVERPQGVVIASVTQPSSAAVPWSTSSLNPAGKRASPGVLP